MSEKMKQKCRVLLKKQGGSWIAQGLEYDIAAQGGTRIEAMRFFVLNLRESIKLHSEKGYAEKNLGIEGPLMPIPQAPGRFFQEWDDAALSVRAPEIEKLEPHLSKSLKAILKALKEREGYVGQHSDYKKDSFSRASSSEASSYFEARVAY